MSYKMDRFEGYHRVESEEIPAWEATVLQFDGFFVIFCVMGLLYVGLSALARYNRKKRNHKKMKAYWQEQRQTYQPW